jgi:hypothetical protein
MAVFTPYNPESPSLQTGDEGNFKSKDEGKSRPLGRGYTGFTPASNRNQPFDYPRSKARGLLRVDTEPRHSTKLMALSLSKGLLTPS